MPVPHPKGRDREQILALLASAQAHIRAGSHVEAASQYRLLLLDPALDDMPGIRTEVLANYGALLLREARLPDTPDAETRLEMAIDLLSRARMGYRLGQGTGSSVTADTNLALAYFQRHLATGRYADLMSAHMVLDGAEAAAADAPDMLDWVRSTRDLLLEHVDRRRNPR